MESWTEPEQTMVFGGSGLLGRELLQKLTIRDTAVATYLRGERRDGLAIKWVRSDVTDLSAVVAAVRSARPTVIINTAYRQNDWDATATGAANVATAAAESGAHLVHISSDAVFSGEESRYQEKARPYPITPYGAAKAAAETSVRAVLPAASIVRTSVIIGEHGDSEHERRARAAARDDGVLFRDDVRCPVHVSDLAEAVLELADGRESGIFHAAGADEVSRYNLGRMIAIRDGFDPGSITSGYRADLPTPGPINVRLDSTWTQSLLRTRLRGAEEFLSMR